MKAYFSMAYGGPDKSLIGELPDPVPGKNQLLVEVKAASINPVDYKVKRGDVKFLSGGKFPKIVGSDFAGIVRSVPHGVNHFVSGDRVYGAVSVLFGKQGALAELVTVDVNAVSKIPVELSFSEAASLPVAALTALNGIRRCRVKSGTSILINGSTGGVGHFAVQIARAAGAVITASCKEKNADFIRNLGADHTIGYGNEILSGTSQKYDAIFDAYGTMPYGNIRKLLKRGGVYASTIPSPARFLLSFPMKLLFGITLTSANMRARREDFTELEKLVTEGKVVPFIECPFNFRTVVSAFALAEKGGFRGKIVVTIP
jgi:NADPH:quinone reductase-like Zn-dependent oxidoreductase